MQAALQACDGLDGVKDGVIDSPNQCTFDPKVLACSGADQPTCLTPAQVETARAMYGPVKDPKTGATLSFPMYHPGSELGWATLAGPQPYAIALEAFRYVVLQRSGVGSGLDEPHDATFRVSNIRRPAWSHRPPT